MFKRILKKIIVTLHMQKIAYFLFNIYASIYRYHTVQRDGIFFALDLIESVDRGIFLAGWEPLTIKWLKENLHPGDVVIEVGANVGAHSLIISQIIGDTGKLYVFEPTDYAFKKLQSNYDLNKNLAQNTTLNKLFVSNKENAKKNFKIRSSWKVNKTKKIADKMDENFSGEIINIDNFFKGLSRVNLIKIDVDGFDFKVLQGAEDIIRLHQPTIFVELGEADLQKNGDSVEKVINFFSDLNYSGVLENGEIITSASKLKGSLKLATHSNGIFTPMIN